MTDVTQAQVAQFAALRVVPISSTFGPLCQSFWDGLHIKVNKQVRKKPANWSLLDMPDFSYNKNVFSNLYLLIVYVLKT